MSKSISFDVLGTCFAFDAAIAALTDRLGPRLKAINVDPKTLFFSWFYAAQRDFTYLSLVGSYTPIAQVLKHTLRRACLIVDLPADQAPTDEDVAAVMQAVTALEAREGLKACFDGLKGGGWEVLAVTNGGMETSLDYYRKAGVELDAQHLLSCDDMKVAKPDVRVYENANRHLDALGAGKGGGERWFVAAHAWDLIAARKAGFKTAWLGFEEGDPATEVFGEFDVYAGSMGGLLEKMRKL
ncbi:uncharacterized protein LTR77_009603 [Saxophila tyrrhenica]|uniref:Uncharacterized protein n=1 Tax=Saxophila tyrrhenica TaxID=1690608 RepID=A0AAV9NY38_9PEZI|nr:hypothetical protein LTR77_009603 [Saxophila tyrrhenica]